MLSVSLEDAFCKANELVNLYPNQPQVYIRRGMAYFKLAKIAESIQYFAQAERLDPSITPYLWQRGLAYYYAEKFLEGAKQFELDLQVNPHDVEEILWHYLCIARFQGITEAKKILLEVKNDPRLIMQYIYQFYADQVTIEEVLSIGQQEGKRGQFYSHLYLGLYYEAQGDETQSCKYIDQAISQYPLDDYMWYLACVHQKLRAST